jgi:hypothetical protein
LGIVTKMTVDHIVKTNALGTIVAIVVDIVSDVA